MRYNKTNSKWENRRQYDLAGSLSNGVCTILSMFKIVFCDSLPLYYVTATESQETPLKSTWMLSTCVRGN